MSLVSINPSTGKIIQKYKELSHSAIKKKLENVSLAQKNWSNTNLEFRLDVLNEMTGVLNDGKREFSKLMAQEMGKPVIQGEIEIDKCIWLCEYYFKQAPKILKQKEINLRPLKSYISFQPIGIILGIMPWNFPFWQVFRFAIPTLIGGNGAVLKHASNVQGCAMAIESCFINSGFPKHIFTNMPISGRRTELLIKDSRISAVTLTGSTPVGKSVASIAGKYLKKTVLELGGNDPYIILDDANIDEAVNGCIDGRILNAGQSCISAKRIIATEAVYSTFAKKIKMRLSEKIMGDPVDNVDIGPMVSIEARNEVHNQVCMSINLGAVLDLGGVIPNLSGAYYPITLLTNVEPGMPAFDEEIFGPVFSLIKATDEKHAIELANSTSYGLGSAIFTKDLKKGEYLAKNKIHSGVCFVNDYVKSDPRLPFGGIKDSGYGRELSSYGMLEFLNIKTIVVNDESN